MLDSRQWYAVTDTITALFLHGCWFSTHLHYKFSPLRAKKRHRFKTNLITEYESNAHQPTFHLQLFRLNLLQTVNMDQLGIPLKGGAHELKIGSSFSSKKATSDSPAFHAFRYDFKPVSIDTSKPSTVSVSRVWTLGWFLRCKHKICLI